MTATAPSRRIPWRIDGTAGATVWYTLIAVGMTWPLVSGLGRDVAWDLGDPLLNCWILAHGARRMVAALAGDLSALGGYWTAGIFHPAPLTLAYSEALIPQTVQILPVWALTRNPILCYNLLFLSTFVLSGLGVYLWLRQATGDARAAFVAGLLYAFALYRVAQFSHLQVLSSQWMPFTLFAFRRYLDTGRRRALAGAALALWAQNLSCGYYLFYFAPLLAAYLAWEIVDRGRWRDARTLVPVGLSLAGGYAMTLPFLLPYLQLRALGEIERPQAEIMALSADVYSYLSTKEDLHVWGERAQAFPKPEGELFPGAVTPLLAAVGVVAWIVRNLRQSAGGRRPLLRWRVWLAGGSLAACLAYLAATIAVLLSGRIVWDWVVPVRMTSAWRLLNWTLAWAAALLVLSPQARRFVRGVPGSITGFALAAAATAFLLSLGPRIRTLGRSVGEGPYVLLSAIPGIESLRVPARFGMIVLLFLSALAAGGAVALGGWKRWTGRVLVWLAAAVFLVEAAVVPLARNVRITTSGVELTAGGPLGRGADAPAVYRAVAAIEDAVLLEFPFGEPAYELQYMFHSIEHGRPLVNGYSGFGPPAYGEQVAALARVPLIDPDRAWDVLRRSGATHVVVHASAFRNDDADGLSAWLASRGARAVGAFGRDWLFELPGGAPRGAP